MRGVYMTKNKIFIIFLIIMSLRFLMMIFNITFVIDLCNTIFNILFTVGILFILLKYRKDESNIAKGIKYISPVIMIVSLFMFNNVFPMLYPYLLYFIIAVLILPLFEQAMGWKQVLRILGLVILILFVGFIALLGFIFKDFGSISIKDEFVFPNNENRRLIVIDDDQGALGGNTIVLYQQKLGFTGLQCEKQLVFDRWGKEYNLERMYKDITEKIILPCGINIKLQKNYIVDNR